MSSCSFKEIHSKTSFWNEEDGWQQQLWVAEILQLLKVDRVHVISGQDSSAPSRGCQQSLAANILSGRTVSVTRRNRKTVKNACSNLISLHSPKTYKQSQSLLEYKDNHYNFLRGWHSSVLPAFPVPTLLARCFFLLTLRLMERPV